MTENKTVNTEENKTTDKIKNAIDNLKVIEQNNYIKKNSSDSKKLDDLNLKVKFEVFEGFSLNEIGNSNITKIVALNTFDNEISVTLNPSYIEKIFSRNLDLTVDEYYKLVRVVKEESLCSVLILCIKEFIATKEFEIIESLKV